MLPEPINDRVKRVVAAKSTDFVLETFLSDDLNRLEEAKQREQRAKLNAMARAAASSDSDPKGTGTEKGAIESLREGEDCPVCQKILDSIATMPEPKRTKGIAQYGEFRAAIDRSEEAAVEALEGNEVLREALGNVRGVEL